MVLEGSNLRSNNLSVITTTTTKQSLPDCVFQITHQKRLGTFRLLVVLAG